MVIVEGPGSGTEYAIKQAAILGRLDSNDIPVKDNKASREHAKIYKQGNQFAIVDLNSSNGTMVNGERVTKRVLKEGDEIGIGLVKMRYELDDDEKPQATGGSKRMSLDEAFDKGHEDAPATAATAAAAAGSSRDIVMRAHKPLQYQKVKAGRSLVGFDLEQVSNEWRLVIYVLCIAIFAGLVWLVMHFVSGG